MEILAIIPARGGSKGIKRKNIKMFNGRPLIAYTIQQARAAKLITRVIVSTEDREIMNVAQQYGAEVPFLRPRSLAQDNSRATDAFEHLLKKLRKKEGYRPDYIIVLQVTSPLRTVADIDKAINLFLKHNADSLVSICQTENLLITREKKKKARIKIFNPEFLHSPNRQELSDVYKLDGSMIYIVKTGLFLKHKSCFVGKMIGYEIERWRAVDLDEPQDFIVGELLHKNFRTIERDIKIFH